MTNEKSKMICGEYFALKLGEQIAIGILKDQRSCYNENFGGFSLTKFDGTTVTV